MDYAPPFNLSNESKLEAVVREALRHGVEAALRFTMLVVYRNRVYERNPLTIENGIVKPVKGQTSQTLLDALLKNHDPNIEALLSV
jgi:hypothetical protein